MICISPPPPPPLQSQAIIPPGGREPWRKTPSSRPIPSIPARPPPHTQGDKRKSPRSQQAHPVLTQPFESTPRSHLLAFALAHCVVTDKVDAIIHFYTNILGIKVYYFKTGVFIPLSVISVYHEIMYCESLSQEVSSFRNCHPVFKKNKIIETDI